MAATNSSATVKGGFFEVNNVATLTGIQGKSQIRMLVAKLLGKKSQLLMRTKMNALMGAAAGGATTKTLGRVQNSTELGGLRTIENETIASGVSDAADVTEIKADYLGITALTTFGASPPINGDRNPLGTR